MNLDFLNQADQAAINLERAKQALELAKQELDRAKENYDQVFSLAESEGIPKAKLKKLTEERITSIIESGLFEVQSPSKIIGLVKLEKVPRKNKKKDSIDHAITNFEIDESSTPELEV